MHLLSVFTQTDLPKLQVKKLIISYLKKKVTGNVCWTRSVEVSYKNVAKLPARKRASNAVQMLYAETCFNILARENNLQKEKILEKHGTINTTYFLPADFQSFWIKLTSSLPHAYVSICRAEMDC